MTNPVIGESNDYVKRCCVYFDYLKDKDEDNVRRKRYNVGVNKDMLVEDMQPAHLAGIMRFFYEVKMELGMYCFASHHFKYTFCGG
jgi:hypothetical protein